MNYYLQDSGTNNWQLGITTAGDLTQTPTGAQTIVPLVLVDGNGVYWQLGITLAGDLTQTIVGATAITSIILLDSNGRLWAVTVDTNGDLHQDLLIFNVPAGAADCGPDFQWLGGDA